MSAQIRIEDARFDDEARSVVWQSQGVDVQNPATKSFTGQGETAITIILDVDAMFDHVYADLGGSGDLESLDRVIAALTTVRDGLAAAYSGTERDPGRCFAQGDWGRCYGKHGHDLPHGFPEPPTDHPDYKDTEARQRAKTEVWAGSPA